VSCPSTPQHNGPIERKIGLATATGIVIANMIGAGIFTTTGILAGLLPTPRWLLGCWGAGGALAIAGALCYAELATRMPEEGGEYVYLSRLYHPLLGFLTGWTSLIVGFSVPVAASAMGFVEYAWAGIPALAPALGATQLLLTKKLSAVVLIVLFTCLHYLGVRFGGAVQNALTALKILIVSSLALGGMVIGHLSAAPLGQHSGVAASLDPLGIGTAMMLVMFAYSGWNASAYIAGEVIKPRRTLPASLLLGTGIVIVLYLALNLFVLAAVPYPELRGSLTPVEAATVRVFGPTVGHLLGLCVALALLSSLSAFVMIGPRVYYAMARDRLFFTFAAKLHPQHGVPGRSILIQGAIASAMVAIGSFEQLLVYIGFALGIFPLLAVIGLFLARRRGIGEATAVKVPLYPFVPLVYLVCSCCLMIVAWINRPIESSAALLTVACGVPCYLWWVHTARVPHSDPS